MAMDITKFLQLKIDKIKEYLTQSFEDGVGLTEQEWDILDRILYYVSDFTNCLKESGK